MNHERLVEFLLAEWARRERGFRKRLRTAFPGIRQWELYSACKLAQRIEKERKAAKVLH